MLLPAIGEPGQRRLREARVLVVGCGALGSVACDLLARAGIGSLRIADRDLVEISNLQRQVLFDEFDAAEAAPKALAAARRLGSINSHIHVEPRVVDVDSENIERLTDGIDLVIDGTDNVQTRYLINDVSVKRSLPWVYGACVATEGRVMAICPPGTPCLRCVFPDPPPPGGLPTCDTAGVIGPVAAVVGALQAMHAIKLLSGNAQEVAKEMTTLDLWANRIRSISTAGAKRVDCPACGQRQFKFLDSPAREMTVRLCGRNAVQIRPPRDHGGFSLSHLAARLSAVGQVHSSEHLLRVTVDTGIDMTVFSDGRAIVHGTSDLARARSLFARFIGS
jgi:molybdopterin-synthase adenylyltransferase